MLKRKHLLAAAAVFGLALPGFAQAQAPQFFRIGTGSAGGTYYPVGGVLANAISCPPGAPCGEGGGTAGVSGLVAVAQATQGSLQNINLIQSGNAESGFVQSDISHWGFTGTGLFEGRAKTDRVRFMAHLFPEHIHATVRKDSNIRSFEDLRGKRIEGHQNFALRPSVHDFIQLFVRFATGVNLQRANHVHHAFSDNVHRFFCNDIGGVCRRRRSVVGAQRKPFALVRAYTASSDHIVPRKYEQGDENAFNDSADVHCDTTLL